MSKVIQTSLNFLLGKEGSEKKTSKNFKTKMNSVSKGHAYYLRLTTSGVYPLGHDNKYNGFAVRCLLSEPQS